MMQYIDLKTIEESKLDSIFNELTPVSGYCIFIDIVGSSAVKYEHGVKEWIKIHKNTFSVFSELIGIHNFIVKFIGDEIMIFIPEFVLQINEHGVTSCFSLLNELYSSISIIKNFPEKERFLSCKMAINYCKEVYNISFWEGVNDYYGKEIDICARLIGKTVANRIILGEKFMEKLYQYIERNKHQKTAKIINQISEKYSENFKGIPHIVDYRYIDVE